MNWVFLSKLFIGLYDIYGKHVYKNVQLDKFSLSNHSYVASTQINKQNTISNVECNLIHSHNQCMRAPVAWSLYIFFHASFFPLLLALFFVLFKKVPAYLFSIRYFFFSFLFEYYVVLIDIAEFLSRLSSCTSLPMVYELACFPVAFSHTRYY